jgi:hypothetical protein
MRTQTFVMGLILFGLLCVMAALWSCSGVELIPSTIGADTPSEAGGIKIYTGADKYPHGNEYITLYIENKSAGEIAFGLEWRAEVNLGGTWYQLPFKEQMTIPDIAQVVAAGETGGIKVDLSALDYEITEGLYRIVKNIGGTTLAAQFEIDKNSPGETMT